MANSISSQNSKKIQVSIGILAYNESAIIRKTLESLLQQSIFAPDSQISTEVVVVANGCHDDTVDISRIAFKELIEPSRNSQIRWQVCDVEQPGKCNAWNRYIADFSNPDADYLFLMDADIQFLETDTLQKMIEALETNSDAWVCVDTPIKDVALKEKKNFLEWLSVMVSASAANQGPPGICGQLYCGKAQVLRRMSLPTTMQVEDGFLATMVRTDGFTTDSRSDRIIRAQSASHLFEAYTNLNRLLRHERWIVIANTIDSFLYKDLQAKCNPQQDAGSLIKHWNAENPTWLQQVIQQHLSQQGWWVIPDWFLYRRFRSLTRHPTLKAILLFPIAVIAFLVDLVVLLQANQQLHSESALGYWGKNTSSTVTSTATETKV